MSRVSTAAARTGLAAPNRRLGTREALDDAELADDEVDLRPEKVGRERAEERETRSEVELEPWWEMARARRAWERVTEEEEVIMGL